jgi:hypothetical protein
VCCFSIFFSAFSVGASIPIELWDIEMGPRNYRISPDASTDDVKQEIKTSILIGKAHTALTTTCVSLLFYYDRKDAFPLVGLYLCYCALIYSASSFDNHEIYKTLQLPEAKRALEIFIFHQSSQSSLYGLSGLCFFCGNLDYPSLLDFRFRYCGVLFVASAAVNSFLFE